MDDEFESLTADRGYDQKPVYDAIGNRQHAIHPRTNAVLSVLHSSSVVGNEFSTAQTVCKCRKAIPQHPNEDNTKK